MRVCSTTDLFLLALVLIPLALTAQESERLLPGPLASFAYVAQGPVSLKLPQSSGEKSPAAAVLLSTLVFPGVGNFYAGNSGHGFRHVALGAGGIAAGVLGFRNNEDGLMAAGLVVWIGNWVWSIVSGIEDARAAGRPGGSNGGLACILQPQLVPLGLPSAVGHPPGVTKHRLRLQLVRVTF